MIRRLWRCVWKVCEGKTWQYMYFLTEPVEVDERVPTVAKYLNRAYLGFTRISDATVDAILNQFGSIDEFVHQKLNGPQGGIDTMHGFAPVPFAPVTQRDMEQLENAQGLDKGRVDQEMATIQGRLAHAPKLQEGLERQATQNAARPRRVAFQIKVKKVYGYQCAICGSGLRAPDGTPEVQSAHIYPKRLDGSDDVRNGICLCRRHHWAVDVGWLSIADDYTVLARDELPNHSDYQFIREYAGKSIRLPSRKEFAPHAIFLREHRKLMGFE